MALRSHVCVMQHPTPGGPRARRRGVSPVCHGRSAFTLSQCIKTSSSCVYFQFATDDADNLPDLLIGNKRSRVKGQSPRSRSATPDEGGVSDNGGPCVRSRPVSAASTTSSKSSAATSRVATPLDWRVGKRNCDWSAPGKTQLE